MHEPCLPVQQLLQDGPVMQALLAARLRRSRRAAGAAHRAGGRRRSSGLCFGKKTTSQHNLKTHRQRAAQDSPTPAAQVCMHS